MEIPALAKSILERLRAGGYDAYVVGGAVRDVCMGRPAADWDIATSATPVQIAAAFPDMRNFSLKHETVTLVSGEHHIEVSGFRAGRLGGEGLQGDLAHRDFTINAMAFDPEKGEILDPFGGRKDLAGRRIRAVGRPGDRFGEDPLRIMRAVRFATELGFRIHPDAQKAARAMAGQLASVAAERVRDEWIRLLVSEKPSRGILLMKRLGLLAVLLPELLEGEGMRQNPRFHRFTVFRHTLETLDRVGPDPLLRITALLHDIAKPRARRRIGGRLRFLGHAGSGAELAGEILLRLRFDHDTVDRASHLIANHMRDLDYRQEWSDGSVRRFIRKIGEGNLPLFFPLRRADLLAHGVLDDKIELFSELEERIGRLLATPFPKSRPELAIDGRRVMEVLGLSPGPEVGRVLQTLLERVTDDPGLNTEESLTSVLRSMESAAGRDHKKSD